MSKLLNRLQRLVLLYSRRRFRAHRVIERRRKVIFRSLLIEDVKHNRFFEIYYDEAASYDEFAYVDSAKIEQMIDLSDLLVCISRLTFDAFLYPRVNDLPLGSSLDDALDLASTKRKAWNEQISSVAEGAKLADSSEPPSLITFDGDNLGNISPGQHEGLIPMPEFSGNETQTSLDDKIRELAAELRAKVGRRNIYWLTTSKNGDRERQVLTLDSESTR